MHFINKFTVHRINKYHNLSTSQWNKETKMRFWSTLKYKLVKFITLLCKMKTFIPYYADKTCKLPKARCSLPSQHLLPSFSFVYMTLIRMTTKICSMLAPFFLSRFYSFCSNVVTLCNFKRSLSSHIKSWWHIFVWCWRL